MWYFNEGIANHVHTAWFPEMGCGIFYCPILFSCISWNFFKNIGFISFSLQLFIVLFPWFENFQIFSILASIFPGFLLALIRNKKFKISITEFLINFSWVSLPLSNQRTHWIKEIDDVETLNIPKWWTTFF